MPKKKRTQIVEVSTSSAHNQSASSTVIAKTLKKRKQANPVISSNDDDNDPDFKPNTSAAKKAKKSVQSKTSRVEDSFKSNEPPTFVQIPGKNFWWVPQESYIQTQVDNFTAKLNPLEISIEPFEGIKNSSEQWRRDMYDKVCSYPTFMDLKFPNMRNGQSRNENMVHRALIAKSKSGEILGAIYFIIDLNFRVCEIEAIEVDEEHRNKKVGTYLQQTAILISLLYGCDQLKVYSIAARSFYERHGFVFSDEDEESEDSSSSAENSQESQESTKSDSSEWCYFDISVPASVKKLLHCVSQWTSTAYLKSLTTMLSKNAATLTKEMSFTGDLRPSNDEFPLQAFLASYQLRNQTKEKLANEYIAMQAAKTFKSTVSFDSIPALTSSTMLVNASTTSNIQSVPVTRSSTGPSFWKQRETTWRQNDMNAVTDDDFNDWANSIGS